MKKQRESHVLEFVALADRAVREGRSGDNWADRIRAVSNAIDIALQLGFWWAPDDFAELRKRYGSFRCQNGVVFGVTERHHAIAVSAGNISAANSIDAFFKQSAMYGIDRKGIRRRLSIQSEFVVDRALWTVTRLPHEVDLQIPHCTLGATRHEFDPGTRSKKVVSRRTFTQEQLCAPAKKKEPAQ